MQSTSGPRLFLPLHFFEDSKDLRFLCAVGTTESAGLLCPGTSPLRDVLDIADLDRATQALGEDAGSFASAQKFLPYLSTFASQVDEARRKRRVTEW